MIGVIPGQKMRILPLFFKRRLQTDDPGVHGPQAGGGPGVGPLAGLDPGSHVAREPANFSGVYELDSVDDIARRRDFVGEPVVDVADVGAFEAPIEAAAGKTTTGLGGGL